MARVGLLFTLGLTMLALIVFSLAMLIFANYQTTEKRVAELGIADRVYALDRSLQLGIRDIFNVESGINIISESNSISFREQLPNSNNFAGELGNFKIFVEERSNAKLDTSLANELPLIIMPHNITYTHNYNDNQTTVIPLSLNLSGYEVNIMTNEVLDSNSCKGGTKPQESLSLDVSATGSEGSCSISKAKVEIENAANKDIALLEITDDILNITAFYDITITTKIVSLADSGEQITVLYPDIISINFPELGIKKSGSARIL